MVMNLRLFDKVYYKKDKKGKKLIYLGRVALLNVENIKGYTLLYGYNSGWKLEENQLEESVIEQLKKNNTYFKYEKYFLANLLQDNIFVIKHEATFIKNE